MHSNVSSKIVAFALVVSLIGPFFASAYSEGTYTPPPGAPGTPTFSNVAQTTMRISWTAASGSVTNYRIERCSGSGCTGFGQIAQNITNLFYDDSGLAANTTYRYRVRANGPGGLGAYSTPAERATLPNPPIAPGRPSFTSIAATTMRVNWFAASGATSYKVERCSGAGCSNFGQIASGVTNTFYDDSGLSNGTLYRYRVRGNNTGGDGSYSLIGEQTTGAVTRVFLTSGTSWSVPLDWNNSNNSIETIGGGGGGASWTSGGGGEGGGGGAYSRLDNAFLTPGTTVTYAIGAGGTAGVAGGDTYLCNKTTSCTAITDASVVVGARGGGGAVTSPGSGGSGANSVGTTRNAGGPGGSSGTTGAPWGGAGGGGAGGPDGVGRIGGGAGNQGGGGGGGANNGTTGAVGGSTDGGAGGNGLDGFGGGAGGVSGSVNGGAGSNGSGGGGGRGSTNGTGGNGGAGVEWTTAGAGGGGGGSGDASAAKAPGAGGLYGGGGGGAAADSGGTGGSGAQGIIVITYVRTVGSSPGTPTYSSVGQTTMRVNWSAGLGAASYKVERCSGSGCSNFSQIASAVTNTYYDDSGLSVGTTYRYRVRGTNTAGDGPYSEISQQSTLPTAPAAPTTLNVATHGMRVSWSAVSGATTYKVERCSGSGCSNFALVATGLTTTYFDDAGLADNTIYRYRVAGSNSGGDGPFSSAIEQTTGGCGSGGEGGNVYGYAWSDNIGWISFNSSTDPCTASTYGMTIDEAGVFGGYAWSDNIGWVSAESADVSGCPVSPCAPSISMEGVVTGWLKALSPSGSQGWDGWISLSGDSPVYGISLGEGVFSGYAWGSTVVGWVSFAGNGYSVQTDYTPCTPNYQCVDTTHYDNTCTAGTVENYQCDGGLVCGGGAVACTIPPNPAGNLFLNPRLVPSGETTEITWDVNDTISCRVYDEDGNDWFGGAVGGPAQSFPIIKTTLFTLECSDLLGSATTTIDTEYAVVVPTWVER